MKEHSTEKQPKMARTTARRNGRKLTGPLTIGIDVGDRSSRYCLLNEVGEVVSEGTLATTRKGLNQVFGKMVRSRVALEAGCHSPWVSRHLKQLGHEVIVANPRKVRLITDSSRKNDRMDAQTLARLARVDPELLSPIRHRGERAQVDLMTIRARAALVEARTMLVNSLRGLAKSFGDRLPMCHPGQVDEDLLEELSEPLRPALAPLLAQVRTLTEQIHAYDRQIQQMLRERYAEAELLMQVKGVGPLIALTYMLTVEDPSRFRRSRDAGCYVGLRPRQRQSGERNPEMHISKEGDPYLRKLLVQGAHYILGPFGPDTDLRRWGLKLAARGGKNAKKRARVAVARKLAVLLHHLWVSGEVYEPLRLVHPPAATAAA
ncbi:MAG: IS110 family transposase [Bryobacteraceae bacterium]